MILLSARRRIFSACIVFLIYTTQFSNCSFAQETGSVSMNMVAGGWQCVGVGTCFETNAELAKESPRPTGPNRAQYSNPKPDIRSCTALNTPTRRSKNTTYALIDFRANLSHDKCNKIDLLRDGNGARKGTMAPANLPWLTSGTWRRRADAEVSLALVDPSAGLLEARNQGNYIRVAATPENNKVLETTPFYIYPKYNGDSLLLSNIRSEKGEHYQDIRFFNRDGSLARTVELRKQKIFDTTRNKVANLAGAYRLAPAGDGALIIGDVLAPNEPSDFWSTFMYIDQSTTKTVNLTLNGDEPLRHLVDKYYARDFTLMTAVGNKVYILIMEENPWIAEYSQYSRELKPLSRLPKKYSLPRFESRSDFESRGEQLLYLRELYLTIEKSAMPIGLYSHDEDLFLLAKSAAGTNGATSWQLQKISRFGAQLGKPIELQQVNSQHVVIVPPTKEFDFFGVIQKGHLDEVSRNAGRRYLFRPLESMIAYPGKNLKQLREETAKAICL